MDGFELNKIAGAVLAAGLLIMGGRTLMEIVDHPKPPQVAGFVLPKPKGGAPGASAAPASAAFDFKSVAALLPKGSVDAGKDVFRKCVSCHTVEKGGPNRVGPNLWGVVNKDVGKHAGFAFSPALQGKGGKWTWEALATYLYNPSAAIPNNKMVFPGIKDDADLADLLAYLRTQADAPAALPN